MARKVRPILSGFIGIGGGRDVRLSPDMEFDETHEFVQRNLSLFGPVYVTSDGRDVNAQVATVTPDGPLPAVEPATAVETSPPAVKPTPAPGVRREPGTRIAW